MDLGVGQVILAVLAAAALIKVVVPPLMFRLGLLRLRVRVDDDPASAQPRGDDPSFRERSEQFRELGFRPLGTTYETCWFITPHDWLWRSRPVRWMATPDNRTLASFSRLIDEEPIRFSAVTVLEGGALVRTTCPGTGSATGPFPDNYHRIQLPGADPAELVSRHQTEVSAFSAERGCGVVAATLQRAADVDAAIDRFTLPRLKHAAAQQIIMTTFGVPAFLTLLLRGPRLGAAAWTDFAIAICVGAAVYEATIRFLVRGQFRKLVLASHTAASGPPPISSTEPDGEELEASARRSGMTTPGRTILFWSSTVVFFVIFWQILNHRGR